MKPITMLGCVLALAALAGCVAPVGPVEVTRFHLPDTSALGQGTIAVEPASGQDAGSLEFRSYAGAVERELAALGYRMALGAGSRQVALLRLERHSLRPGRARGPVSVGVESTIVGCFATPLLLRPGGLPREEIEQVLGEKLARIPDDDGKADAQPLAPGMLASHYAPRTTVRLNAATLEGGEALLAFGPHLIPGSDQAIVMNLSEAGDLVEAAANLFGYLRDLDAKGPRAIAVMPIPHDGLGEAINDRLQRAAIPRS